MKYQFNDSEEFAKAEDLSDSLCSIRTLFEIPKTENGDDVVYFCGNSLGLMPKATRIILNQELDDWAKYGVEGHFEAKRPWYSYHELLSSPMAKLIGGKPSEVVVMNSLTTNLHLLMVSFYRPTKTKYKILMDYSAFPSDQYAVASQLRFHGFDENDGRLELKPTNGEIVETNSIIKTMHENKDEIALILLGGVNYYTGQAYDIKAISKVANELGIVIGLDLAHAAGNIKLNLHEDDIDFAAWCTYKYLNSGPGSLSGVFIHEKHHGNENLPRFEGWWGHDKSVRFLMESTFVPIKSAEAWQLSNPAILSMAAIYSSLQIFDQAGFQNLIIKSQKLSSYLIYLLNKRLEGKIKLLTPTNIKERGAQLSIVISKGGKEVYDRLVKNNVICDWREPSVIRVAPVPLYNSFLDVYKFVDRLEDALTEK